MDLDSIAEQKILDAIGEGVFENLPGHGKPLELEDLSRVPEDLRAGYLLLKGAHVLPEEMQLKKEILRLEDLLAACRGDEEREALRETSRQLSLRYRLLMEKRGRTAASAEYAAQVVQRLGRS